MHPARQRLTAWKLTKPNQCIRIVFARISVCVPYLHEHDEAHKEGEEADTEKEQLSAVLPAEHSWVHVDDCCDQALYTHKLSREREEMAKIRETIARTEGRTEGRSDGRTEGRTDG